MEEPKKKKRRRREKDVCEAQVIRNRCRGRTRDERVGIEREGARRIRRRIRRRRKRGGGEGRRKIRKQRGREREVGGPTSSKNSGPKALGPLAPS